jgi:hypothetical protein
MAWHDQLDEATEDDQWKIDNGYLTDDEPQPAVKKTAPRKRAAKKSAATFEVHDGGKTGEGVGEGPA